jgi:hypothetical protein
MFYSLVCAAVTCCTAGVSFFAIVSIILDGVMIALMIALAAINGSGRHSCSGGDPYPRTVYDGSGTSGCRLFQASFAVTIIAIVAFLVAAVAQFMIRRRSRTHTSRVSKGMWTCTFRIGRTIANFLSCSLNDCTITANVNNNNNNS